MDYALVTTTFEKKEDAKTCAKAVLNARLAACAQYVPIESDSWWLGDMQNMQETLVQFKTRGAFVEDLKQMILNHHPYKTPQIVVYAIAGGSAPYLRWITDETAGGRL